MISVFMRGFTRAVPHLSSLDGTAALYNVLARVWRRDEQVLGLLTLRLRYEDLVVEPGRESRRLVEFIGGPWNDAVLHYHAPEHRRFVVTPSFSDVSKPVYSTARGRWRRYREHLAPVLPVLEPWVAEGGYELS